MVKATALNDVYISVETDDDSTRKELYDYFTFEPPDAVHMRRNSRYKGWDGRIRLMKSNGRLYRGLLHQLQVFCDDRDYEFINDVPAAIPIDVDTITTNPPLRDYQEHGVRIALRDHRALLVSPTASGKSLIIHTIQDLLGVPILVIVPTKMLVSQMHDDFIDYGMDPTDIQTIIGGKDKIARKRVVISTWHSIYTQPSDYFNTFGAIFVDEVHLAKAKSLTGIMEAATAVPFRFGFTGTLGELKVHHLILEGLFGRTHTLTDTATLIERKQVAAVNIKMCVLDYAPAIKDQYRRASYQDEIDFIVGHEARNLFITQLVRKLKGNTIILCQFVEKHGAILRDMFQTSGDTRPVYYIDGQVKATERDTIRKGMESDDGAILIATYGTTQLGVSIKKLHNLILAHPAKGSIRVLQSIGRVLRLHNSKSTATVYDLVDDLRVAKWRNHTFNHAAKRSEYYADQQFPTQMVTFNLERLTNVYSSFQRHKVQLL